ncbi:putative Heat shock protein 70 family [Helianthus annuus]|uniref:Heat shock protein 70 family n=1 Tax=Helianthus annuus TaxID=4232 RepID=A0A251SAD1_HELAN|nr:putative Heat shock protein 70 family [Helianthus annuus]KAJ0451731.1 putative Heat shock protein 70 family [Helianthus annuus]KAJ0473617.1 putative Heat shock protein 70 family [Helianthus annuus]KAJ0649194.1 putative Heat shock protein 70 family [Helianthus annuus]KAJ0652996.1 putative Heat shock protein 70 family [Helianthus annuus]
MLMEFFDWKPLCKSIKADEAVANGAAVLAANLCGIGNKVVKDLALLDVTPLSLGTSVYYEHLKEGYMSVIIPWNTPIPTIMEKVYWTSGDNQASMRVDVYQGESTKVKDNIFLDEFIICDVPPAPKGDEKN